MTMFDKAKGAIRAALDVFTEDDGKRDKSDKYTPSEEDLRILSTCQRFYDEGKALKSGKEEVWKTAHRFINLNQQWEAKRPPEFSDYTGNLLLSNVQQKAAIMTDNRPMFNIMPMFSQTIGTGLEAAKDSTTKILKHILEGYGWYHWGIESTIDTIAKETFIVGTGIVKIVWDPDLNYGLGDIRICRVSPYNFLIDPDCDEDPQNALFTIELIKMRLVDIQRIYDNGIYVKAQGEHDFEDINDSMKYEISAAEEVGGGHLDSAARASGGPWRNTNGAANTAPSKYDYALVRELRFKDKTTVEIEEPVLDEQGNIQINPETGDLVTEKKFKLKYPKGRLVISSGDVVLFDGDSEYTDGKFPYAVVRDYSTPGEFWGRGEVEVHQKSQKLLNTLMCRCADYMNGVNCKTLIKRGTLKPGEKPTNRSWDFMEVSDTNDVKYLLPPELPSSYFPFIGTIRQIFDTESGLHDTSRGSGANKQERVGVALANQESDFTRMRPIIRGFERFISEIGEQCISRLIQFQQTSRSYVFTNSTTGENEYATYKGFPEDIDILYKVSIKSNSTLPADKSSRAALSMQLFQMGVIGQKSLLESLEWPDIETAIQEIGQLKQLQQENEMLKQQVKQSQTDAAQKDQQMSQLGNKTKQAEDKADSAQREADMVSIESMINKQADSLATQIGRESESANMQGPY